MESSHGAAIRYWLPMAPCQVSLKPASSVYLGIVPILPFPTCPNSSQFCHPTLPVSAQRSVTA